MTELIQEFFNFLQRWERLCGERYHSVHGAQLYLDELKERSPRGMLLVSGWAEDVQALLRIRELRNRLVHCRNSEKEPEIGQCTEALRDLCWRMQENDDPLSRLEKEENRNPCQKQSLLDQAIVFATEAHAGQTRKGCHIPFILHPLETAAIAATVTDDEEVLAAAVLHDTVEDTDATVEQIRSRFGPRVAELVAGESENKREDRPAEETWKVRKQETLEHLKTAPREIKIITLGDKLSNMRALYRDRLVLGDRLWDRFNQKDPKEHAWYYAGIAQRLSEFAGTPAYEEYLQLVEKTFE